MIGEPCLFFGFDDDIFYSSNYVSHLDAALRRYRYRAIVGIHACIYSIPLRSYVRDRIVNHFTRESPVDCLVDEIGTGTIAFHSGCIKIEPHRWEHHNMDDLTVMIDAVRQGVLRIAVRRPANFLQPIFENQDDSIYTRSLADNSVETRLLQEAMTEYPDFWCMSG
jgi:hypothetical protein